jgi:hypothetical protein
MKKALTIIMAAAAALFCIPSCSEYGEGLSGDLNGDGHLSQKDIQLLENLIQEGSHNRKGDLNDDGKVDQDDLEELKDRVCEANGAGRNEQGECCFTSNDQTVCCDAEYDGDFEECTPPNVQCEVDSDCALNCPAACVNGKCRCIGTCDGDDDCFPLNCPAFCNDQGTCECKIFCRADDDCAFISKCRSVCGDAGYCVCDDTTCLGQGQDFMGDPQNHDCCPGLQPAEYWAGECAYVDCLCFVCAACGNDACEAGENPCNCPADCGQCVPGDIRYHYCGDGQKVFWCECKSDATWECINSPETQCGQDLCAEVSCNQGYVCDPKSGDCVIDCRLANCDPGQNCIVCAESELCDPDSGLCVPDPCYQVSCSPGFHCQEGSCVADNCLPEGGKFESFQNENPCCAGLVPVPDHFPENGTCVGPNCPCFVCTRCGTDEGVCSLGENRCNCPQDCVTAHNCTAQECVSVARDYAVSGTCPAIPAGNPMHRIDQAACALTFSGVLADVLGESGCIDHSVIYTQNGCQGMVTVTGASRTMYFTCPWSNSNDTQANCTVFLDDLLD